MTILNYAVADSELAGSLEWLATCLADDEDRGEPQDGAIFDGRSTEIYYVACHRKQDGSYAVPDCAYPPLALTFGDGLGWFEDMLISYSDSFWNRIVRDGEDPSPEERRAEEWAEVQRRLDKEGTDPVEYIACIVGEYKGILTYHRNPPRMTWATLPVQP